jgi:hypothetical protein
MIRVDRWRKWCPSMKKFGDASKQELTKLTKGGSVSFVSSDSTNAPNFSSRLGAADPVAWAENFHRWMLERCAFRIRCFGGVESLYRDLYKWSVARQDEPPSRLVFDQLLGSSGLFQANGLVSGLVLREDVDSVRSTDRPQNSHPKKRNESPIVEVFHCQPQSKRSNRHDN